MHRALVLVLSAVALWGCSKKEEVRVEAPPPAPRLPESPKTPVGMAVPPDAEVEVIGTWRSGVKAAQHVAVAQKEPCLPVPATPTRYGASVTLSAQGALFAEFFLPQGTVAHVPTPRNPLPFLGFFAKGPSPMNSPFNISSQWRRNSRIGTCMFCWRFAPTRE